jgi:ribulose-5-phosphate 4-epimerase/fuculose-1-phosphate aldolase
MTHAAIYQLDQHIGAIVHGHSLSLWEKYKDALPTTRPEVAYGTPEMALEFQRLYRDTAFRSERVAVMAGHEEGIISFGFSLEQAANRLLDLAER